MRRISIAMTTILMAALMCLSTLFGCNLVTTNYERDMKQVVATIQIDPSAPKDVIYKKDLIASYINHTSSESDHSHGSQQNIFEEIVDELINDAVFVQYAMQYFANETGFSVTDENKWEIETYLDEDEILDAKYSTHLDINSLLDSYVEEDEKVGDTFSGSVRVKPTGAQNDTEVSKAEKLEYINNGVIDVTGKRQAFAKVINMLEENDLLGDTYKNGQLETTEYYSLVLESYQESSLLAKLEETVERKSRANISYEDVKLEYERLYALQKEYDTADFETALSDNFNTTTPILYGRTGYGTVYHVLLKATDEMTQALTEWKEENNKKDGAYLNADYSRERAKLFADITAKEQRESWVYLGYDFNGTSFTGDYTLCEEESLPFYGSVTLLNGADKDKEDYRAKYRVDNVEEFSLKEILDKINQYLYNGTANIPQELDEIDSFTYQATDINADFNNRVRELMFAFSEDDSDSALNTYKGYVIKPPTDADEPEEWMEEFAEEGRNLIISKDQKTFKVVATDYGYHIMFVGENFDPATYDFPTLKDFLNYQFGKNGDDAFWKSEYEKMLADWKDYEDTNSYMYTLTSSLSATTVDRSYATIQQEVIRDYVSNSNVVVKDQNVYQDLIKQ